MCYILCHPGFLDYNFSSKGSDFVFSSQNLFSDWEDLAGSNYDFQLIIRAWGNVAGLLVILRAAQGSLLSLTVPDRFETISEQKRDETKPTRPLTASGANFWSKR